MKDDDLDRLTRGGLSHALQVHLAKKIERQRAEILTIAVRDYKAGTLSGDAARAAIAELSALKDLTDALDRDVRQGREVQTRAMASTPA